MSLELLSDVGLKTGLIRVVWSNFLPCEYSHLCLEVGLGESPVLLNSKEVNQEKIFYENMTKQYELFRLRLY